MRWFTQLLILIYTIIARYPATEISTEINVYHHFRTSTNWYRRMSFVTSWRHFMTLWLHANTKTITFSNLVSRKTIETKKNHLSSTSTSWDRVQPVFDVMAWCHDVTSSCKYNTENIFELGNPKYLRKQKKNHFSSTSTSWDRENKFCYVMPWRHDVTVSHGWVKSKSLNCILWVGPGAMRKWHFQ